MTEQQIDRERLRKLADAATPGPWRIGEAFDEPACWVAHLSDNGWDDSTTVTSQDTTGHDDQEVRDAEFIAAARAAVPQLLDQLDQAEAERDYRRRENAELVQEAKDERGAALDLIEQVRIRDARITAWEQQYAQDIADANQATDEAEARIKAVQDVLDQHDDTARIPARRIRRALDGG